MAFLGAVACMDEDMDEDSARAGDSAEQWSLVFSNTFLQQNVAFSEDFDCELQRAARRQVAIGWITLQHDIKQYISDSSTTTIR